MEQYRSSANVLPLLEEDGLLNLEMLHVAEKDNVAPAPSSAPASPTTDTEEKEQVIQIPKESCTSEQEEAAHLEGGLDLIWRRYPAIPLGFTHLQANQTCASLVRGIPPRSTTRSPLSGVTGGNYLPWPSSQGGAL